MQRVQNAADAASLGVVTYMPQDLTKARTEAEVVSTRNSYPNSGTSTVTTEQGDKPSRVRVTVCSTIDNTFGGIIGIARTKICRTAVADYAGPQPMGSPCYVPSQDRCDLTPSGSYPTSWSNPWVTTTDAPNRYKGTTGSDSPTEFCTGNQPATSVPTITSFGLRQPTDTQNPLLATPQPDCTKQYVGFNTSDFSYANLSTNNALSQSFHLWRSLCTFTPTRAGDYYLQVRTNVAMGGAVNQNDGSYRPVNVSGSAMFTQAGDDPSVKGGGANRCAVRGYLTSGASAPGAVSVAAYGRMPIYANADSASSTFNLIRVLPGAGGKTHAVHLLRPRRRRQPRNGDSTEADRLEPSDQPQRLLGHWLQGSQQSHQLLSQRTLQQCRLERQDRDHRGADPVLLHLHRHQRRRVLVPVQVSFPGGHVTDTTTWTANITGDPVRLVE